MAHRWVFWHTDEQYVLFFRNNRGNKYYFSNYCGQSYDTVDWELPDPTFKGAYKRKINKGRVNVDEIYTYWYGETVIHLSIQVDIYKFGIKVCTKCLWECMHSCINMKTPLGFIIFSEICNGVMDFE